MRNIFIIGLLLISFTSLSQNDKIAEIAERLSNELNPLYIDLHQNPELSFMKFKTAKKMAVKLRELGFEVTEGVGGNGVVGVFKMEKAKPLCSELIWTPYPLKKTLHCLMPVR